MTPSRVVIIGAGVMGASVAAHLAERGVQEIIVIDRESALGGGSSGRATGGFRAQFDSAVNVRLSLRSREKLRMFADTTGVDPGYEAHGYLWLAGSERDLTTLRDGLLVQHAEGLHEAREVSLDEIATINPAVCLDGIAGGAFCPTDGFLRPRDIVRGYLALAIRRGAHVHWDTIATGFDRTFDGRVRVVHTTHGSLACDAVVNATGPWAAAVAQWAGVDLPVRPVRRQAASTVHTHALPASMPMTIFTEDGFHLRVRNGRVLLLCPSAGDPRDPFLTSVEAEWLVHVAHLANMRVPALRDVPIDVPMCWAGLYEMSPDHHAIVGAHPSCPNLYFVNGSSGHGVMHAPALGEVVAAQVCGAEADPMIAAPLDVSRFTSGAHIEGSQLL